jgi:REP element-mobilizing transposase RayT
MDNYNRRSIRLKNYDYSQAGAYFVTICCKNQQCYFGRIENRKIILSTSGKIAKMNWENIPRHYKNVILDEYVIMPNHLHGIIHIIHDDNRRGLINQTSTINPEASTIPPRTLTMEPHIIPKNTSDVSHWILMKDPNITLGKILRYFKAKSTRFIRQNGYKNFAWQRNYYEHIIHNKNVLNRIRNYINDNPFKWKIK